MSRAACAGRGAANRRSCKKAVTANEKWQAPKGLGTCRGPEKKSSGIDSVIGVAACAVAALAAASAAAGVLALAPVGDHFTKDSADNDNQHAADDPGSHVLPPLCPVGQMVFVVAVPAHQHVDQEDQYDQRGSRGEGEARARCQQAQLVHDQGDGVGEYALVADGEAGPLAVVHLAPDRADGREAGRAQQVE